LGPAVLDRGASSSYELTPCYILAMCSTSSTMLLQPKGTPLIQACGHAHQHSFNPRAPHFFYARVPKHLMLAMLKAGAAALRTAAHCASLLVVKKERRPRWLVACVGGGRAHARAVVARTYAGGSRHAAAGGVGGALLRMRQPWELVAQRWRGGCGHWVVPQVPSGWAREVRRRNEWSK